MTEPLAEPLAQGTGVAAPKPESGAILATRHDGVLVMTMSRPEKKNALTGAMYLDMIARMREAEADPAVRAIVLQGAGGDFTAGNDIGDFLAFAARGGELPALQFVRALATLETPLVAAVEGVAVGVGATALFHCDLVYAAPDARFRMPFIDLGLVPEAGSSLLVPQRAGMAKASAWLLLGDAFGADEAMGFGLVNEVISADRLAERALAQALRLAAKPPNALRLARRLIRGDRGEILARIDEEAMAFAAALKSDEAKAAFLAFMSKSKSKP